LEDSGPGCLVVQWRLFGAMDSDDEDDDDEDDDDDRAINSSSCASFTLGADELGAADRLGFLAKEVARIVAALPLPLPLQVPL
jgi:hypothetical protein